MSVNRRLAVAVALVCGVSLAPVPAHASRALVPCSLVSTNDPTGFIQSNGEVFMATTWGSYVDPQATRITMTCTVMISNFPHVVLTETTDKPDGPDTVAAVALARHYVFSASPGVTVRLCTSVEVTTLSGETYRVVTDVCLTARRIDDVAPWRAYVV